MYIDDLELDLGLACSFDALVDEELGQEVSVNVDIPSSQLPTGTELEVIKATGIVPKLSGLPGQGGRVRLDPVKDIAKDVEKLRAEGKEVDVASFAQQWLAQSPKTWMDEYNRKWTGTEGIKTASTVSSAPQIISLPQETSEYQDLVRKDTIDEIVNNLKEALLPRLKKIDKRLKLAQAQAQATDEHNIKMEKELFRQKVISELKYLSQLLPAGHPLRAKFNNL